MNITKGVIATAQKVVIYGPEGIGKSTLASKFPNPLFIDTEGSTNNMDVARLDKPSSWSMLLEELRFVKESRPCKTLIIDTIDWAERLAIEHTCQSENKTSIEDFGYGSGYVKVEETVGRLLNMLQDLVDSGINVVLTAHAQIRKFEQPDELGAYDRYELKLGKKTQARTSALVKEWADMVLFCNYKVTVTTSNNGKKKAQGGKRIIYTTHTPAWDAKNRFNMPEEMPMDYQSIAAVFDNLPNSQPVEQKEMTETQVDTTQQSQTEPEPAPIPTEAPPEQSEDTVLDPREITSAKSSFDAQATSSEATTDPGIPKPLLDLMKTQQVTPEEIKWAVSERGYYPRDTPITNYDPKFIQGVLIGAWQQVLTMILNNRKGAK